MKKLFAVVTFMVLTLPAAIAQRLPDTARPENYKLTFAPDHLIFFPEELLEILHPLEIADHHAASIAEDIRDNKNLLPTLFQQEIRFRSGRSISSFSEDPAFQILRDSRVDDTLDRRRHQHVAGQR